MNVLGFEYSRWEPNVDWKNPIDGEFGAQTTEDFTNAKVVSDFTFKAIDLRCSCGDDAVLIAHHAHGEETKKHSFQHQKHHPESYQNTANAMLATGNTQYSRGEVMHWPTSVAWATAHMQKALYMRSLAQVNSRRNKYKEQLTFRSHNVRIGRTRAQAHRSIG